MGGGRSCALVLVVQIPSKAWEVGGEGEQNKSTPRIKAQRLAEAVLEFSDTFVTFFGGGYSVGFSHKNRK